MRFWNFDTRSRGEFLCWFRIREREYPVTSRFRENRNQNYHINVQYCHKITILEISEIHFLKHLVKQIVSLQICDQRKNIAPNKIQRIRRPFLLSNFKIDLSENLTWIEYFNIPESQFYFQGCFLKNATIYHCRFGFPRNFYIFYNPSTDNDSNDHNYYYYSYPSDFLSTSVISLWTHIYFLSRYFRSVEERLWCRHVSWWGVLTWPRSGSVERYRISSISCSWTRLPVSSQLIHIDHLIIPTSQLLGKR